MRTHSAQGSTLNGPQNCAPGTMARCGGRRKYEVKRSRTEEYALSYCFSQEEVCGYTRAKAYTKITHAYTR